MRTLLPISIGDIRDQTARSFLEVFQKVRIWIFARGMRKKKPSNKLLTTAGRNHGGLLAKLAAIALILSDGFYEWQKTGKAKQPYYIRMKDGRPVCLGWFMGSLGPRR
jgi:SOS response associated peptidase (SRAP)